MEDKLNYDDYDALLRWGFEVDPYDIDWDIRRDGRAWEGKEARLRWALTPEKIELIDAKVFYDDQQRLKMLGLLLENVGVDKVVRLGGPRVWREAVAELE